MADLVKLRRSHDHRESQWRGATELEADSTWEGFSLLMEHCPTDQEEDIWAHSAEMRYYERKNRRRRRAKASQRLRLGVKR